jgi:transcription elongation factor GreA
MAQTHQLSRTAFDRLQAEHEDLTTRGRIEIAQAIERGVSWVTPENGDYQARDQRGHMEARSGRWRRPRERRRGRRRGRRVSMVLKIRYEGDDDDMAETYLIGHIEEKGELDVISPTSPLGSALMGKSAGDEVEYDAPGGVLKVVILRADAG